MRRKLVKQGQNALTVTLPAKWLKLNNLTVGNEVDIDDSLSKIVISPIKDKPIITIKHTEVVDNMDYYQIKMLITRLYQSKVNQISLKFKNPNINDLKSDKKIPLLKICERMCTRLIGLEIIQKSDKEIVLQCFIGREDEENINIIERRIFLMIKEFMNNIIEKKISGYVETHDQISKFIEYYLRLIVHSNIEAQIKTESHSLMVVIDGIVNQLRFLCSKISKQKKISEKSNEYIKKIFNLFNLYYKFNYSIEKTTISIVEEYRYNLIKEIEKESFNSNESKLLMDIYNIIHTINHFYYFHQFKELSKEKN